MHGIWRTGVGCPSGCAGEPVRFRSSISRLRRHAIAERGLKQIMQHDGVERAEVGRLDVVACLAVFLAVRIGKMKIAVGLVLAGHLDE